MITEANLSGKTSRNINKILEISRKKIFEKKQNTPDQPKS